MAMFADILYANDRDWWQEYIAEVKTTFAGSLVSPVNFSGITRLDLGVTNSGVAALMLAAFMGARRILMLGYDCQRTGGKAHWHSDHPSHMGNAGSLDKWPALFADVARKLTRLNVVNISRQTALDCFQRGKLEDELKVKQPMLISGMHGMGDNLHQRALVRALSPSYDVWLETPWPCLYHDLDVKLLTKGSRLRTQSKNLKRERDKFTRSQPPSNASRITVSYPPVLVRMTGSVLSAMLTQCGVSEIKKPDFRLPIAAEWKKRADEIIKSWKTKKSIMIYRPLVERSEWGGAKGRNPDKMSYVNLFNTIRKKYFVVSIADIEKGREWITSDDIKADVEYHHGELDVEVLAALFKRADLIYTAPGFPVVLSQAVGAKYVAVFGGYENAKSFSSGEKFAKALNIEPINPCDCFSHYHACDKRIDIEAAKKKLLEFVK